MRGGANGWQRFRRNPLALIGLFVLVAFFTAALLGYLIMPDSSPAANRQLLEFARLPPGSRVSLLLIRKEGMKESFSYWQGRSNSFSTMALDKNMPLSFSADSFSYTTATGLTVRASLPPAVLAINLTSPLTQTFIATSGKPYLLNGSMVQYVDTAGAQVTISLAELRARLLQRQVHLFTYWLGSDAFGRDTLSRLILGARVSLGVGLLAMVLSIVLGATLGVVAGYAGSWVDGLISWLMAVIWSLPSLLLAIAIAFAVGKGFTSLCIAIGVSIWVEVARIVRGEVLSLRSRPFVDSARVLGIPTYQILYRHILPGLFPTLIILACANFATAILLEAGLSFLGLGVRPPTPSWGAMINEGYGYMVLQNGRWLALLPGLAIVLLITSLNFVGNGVRDALEPQLK